MTYLGQLTSLLMAVSWGWLLGQWYISIVWLLIWRIFAPGEKPVAVYVAREIQVLYSLHPIVNKKGRVETILDRDSDSLYGTRGGPASRIDFDVCLCMKSANQHVNESVGLAQMYYSPLLRGSLSTCKYIFLRSLPILCYWVDYLTLWQKATSKTCRMEVSHHYEGP